jgi:hypothetical protein
MPAKSHPFETTGNHRAVSGGGKTQTNSGPQKGGGRQEQRPHAAVAATNVTALCALLWTAMKRTETEYEPSN